MSLLRPATKTALLITACITGIFLLPGCLKESSLEQAEGSLLDALGQCRPIEIAGQYRTGQPVDQNRNYIIVTVNVRKAGKYSIETNRENGIFFSTVGEFTNTGMQQVQLFALGTPLGDSLTNLTCRFGQSSCSFQLQVGGSSAAPADSLAEQTINTWEFSDSTDGSYHHGLLDPSGTGYFLTPQTSLLKLTGFPGNNRALNRDTFFLITLFLPHPYIEVGTFPYGSGVGGDNYFEYADSRNLNNNNSTIPAYYESVEIPIYPFIFRIIGYDPDQHLVTGTFAGNCRFHANASDVVGSDHKISGWFKMKTQ